jgi:hypothetical protein
LYTAQQLQGSARAWWASYTTSLPADHHIPWGEFRTAFHAHHRSTGLLHSKLKEFLDLEQGNHFVFNYTRQFNTLAQYGSYHVDTDEKKANLYREVLTVHLQERLGLSPNLSYNELASTAIDQERLMKAIAEADEKKRKRMMPTSSTSDGSSGAPLKYRIVYTPPGGSCADLNISSIGATTCNTSSGSSSHSSSSSSVVLLLHLRSRRPSGHHSSFPPATFHAQLWEDVALYS